MRALVTGGTGFVGSHLVDALLARGDEVTALVRDPAKPRWLAGRDVRFAKGDTTKNEGLAEAVAGAEVVFHVAGVISARTDEEYRAGNAGGAQHLLDACAKAPPRAVVVVTSLAAVGPPADEVAARHGDPCRPVSAYGRSKLAEEAVCASFAGRVPVVVARPPVVYGPRDPATLEIFRIVRARVKPMVRPEQRLSLVHARDLAEGLIACAERGRPGERYFLSHADVITARGLADRVEQALGVTAMPLPIPPAFLRAAAAVTEFFTGNASIFNRDKASEMTAHSWVCDPGLSAERLGWSAKIAHADGFAESASWYSAARWL
jgi:nucleoside-diphosphate-sugar epimerase